MQRSQEPSLFISPNLVCIDVNKPYRDSGCASMDHVGKADVRHESIVWKRMYVNGPCKESGCASGVYCVEADASMDHVRKTDVRKESGCASTQGGEG